MKKDEPLVSVIMNCYNGEKYLREAIDSVLAQTYTNFEVIFWDNQSTDNSAEIVKSYADKRIKYFLGKEHISLGRARNLAIQKAKANYIAFLDVDDLWEPDKLNKQIPYFDDPFVGMVYCQTNLINSESKIIGHLNSKTHRSTTRSFSDLFSNYDVVLSSVVISKKALLSSARAFDSLLIYAEEYDLFMRICSKYEAVKVEKPLALYRLHEGQDTLKLFERSIYEDEYITAKLKLLYPGLFSSRPELLKKRDKKRAWSYFLSFILKKDASEARKKLMPYAFSSPKYFIFYLISFMGSKPVKEIWEKYRVKKQKLPIIS